MAGLPPGDVGRVICLVYMSVVFGLTFLASRPTVGDAPESRGLRMAMPLLHSAQKLQAAFPVGLVCQLMWQQANNPYAPLSKCPICQEHVQ